MADWRLTGFVEERELGRGAQGRVVLARHAETGAPVAIKYLAGGDPAAVAGLRAEAQMLGRLTSPYVARLFRFVESAEGSAIVMEAVNGASLKAVLAEHGRLAPEAALLVLKGSLLGLAAAHAVGVVHRDYKPANVVVRPDGLSKLVDFGVAVLAGEGSAAGTPAYMAPEQWRGEAATPATDVYAATCVFVECVTGRRPFAAGERVALMNQHLTAEADMGDVPERLRPLVAKGLAKQAGDRPPGAAAFVGELESAAVAAYGPDWEQRGVRALAAAAVALAALFPLGALAVAPGAAAGTGAAGTAGAAGAAGTGGGVSAGAGSTGAAVSKGFLATAAGKGALAAAGVAVVAAAAGGAVYATKDSTKKTPQDHPRLVLAAQTETIPGTSVKVDGAKYATVSGLHDAALQRRINAELRAPLDDLIALAKDSRKQVACGSTPTTVTVQTRVGLNGPRLVSVRYFQMSDWCRQADGSPGGEVVTVDLRTGRRVTASDVFRPGTLTAAGLGTLKSRLVQRDGRTPISDCPASDPWKPADFQPAPAEGLYKGASKTPPHLSAYLTPSDFQLAWFGSGSDGCGNLDFGAPYAKIRDLLKPEFAALLPK
ncbi:serine/threonine-protein kinase [Actinomadura sp. NPDC048394]|uniref:serine/threonine-protein kinase n=1 Tax=Actinomadura sp. NPDC048394 TaxID=3158223 RepID=UPI0033FD77F8